MENILKGARSKWNLSYRGKTFPVTKNFFSSKRKLHSILFKKKNYYLIGVSRILSIKSVIYGANRNQITHYYIVPQVLMSLISLPYSFHPSGFYYICFAYNVQDFYLYLFGRIRKNTSIPSLLKQRSKSNFLNIANTFNLFIFALLK